MEDRTEIKEQITEEKQGSRNASFLKGALTGALVVLIIVAIAGTVGYKTLFHGSGADANEAILSSATETKLNFIRELMNQKYLYDIDDSDLQDGIYEGYVNGLNDPYSVYYNEEATKELLETTSGQYQGIGAVMTQDQTTHYLMVMNVYQGSPAEKAGLLEGDIIYQVDDKKINKEDSTEVVSWIRGEAGTDVTIHVYRGESLDEVDIIATRAVVDSQTVEYELKDDGVGYLRVSEFDTVTYDQFAAALTELENQGAKGLIIDLRSNPGGDVETTCKMLRLLLPEGMIVYTEDKNGEKAEYTCDQASGFNLPLEILVDGNSASASEIFAGAIQDYGIGDIVGTTTYGKGIVQNLYDLMDGTYLKITTAEYFTPNGRTINKIGLEPDVEVKYEYNEADPTVDNQLEKAMEVIREKL